MARALQPKPKAKRQPAITDLGELRTLLGATERSGAYPVTLLASRLLALAAPRPGVIRGALWTEFKNIDWESDAPAPDAIWHVLAARMKLILERKDEDAFDHIMPLVPASVDVVRAVRRLTGSASSHSPAFATLTSPCQSMQSDTYTIAAAITASTSRMAGGPRSAL